MSFDWRPESKDRYFRKAEAAVKAAGFDDILQISREQFAITKSTVKVKDCKHVCLFCEYYDMCKEEAKANEHEICKEK